MAGKAFLLSVSVSTLVGCGGGGGGNGGNSDNGPKAGIARVTIAWPGRSRSRSAVPSGTAYVIITARQSASYFEKKTDPIPRPAGSAATATTTEITNLPPGNISLAIAAYPEDINGVQQDALATGVMVVTVAAGQVVNVDTSASSNVDHMEIQNGAGQTMTGADLIVGQETTLYAAPLTREGTRPLLDPAQLIWSVTGQTLALANTGGSVTGTTANVRGLTTSAAGSGDSITVRETESGQSASIQIVVKASNVPAYTISFLFNVVSGGSGRQRSRQADVQSIPLWNGDINNRGEIVGFSGNGFTSDVVELVLKRPGEAPMSLGVSGSGSSGELGFVALNENTQVLAKVIKPSDSFAYESYFWENGNLTLLFDAASPVQVWGLNNQGVILTSSGLLKDGNQVASLADGRAINNENQVIGLSHGTPFLWENGNAHSLPLPGGYPPAGYPWQEQSLGYFRMNDRGEAIASGNAWFDNRIGHNVASWIPWWHGMDFGEVNVLYDPRLLPGFTTPNPTYPVQRFIAWDINNVGVIVGEVYVAKSGEFNRIWDRAVLWPDGSAAPIWLDSLIDADSGWTLLSANAINDHGQIIGTGLYNNRSAAYLLTPKA